MDKQHSDTLLLGRDDLPADPNHIYLSGGASSAVNTLLHTICAGSSTGVMVPIPQYPLYTALLSLLGAKCVPYYLDESSGWSTSVRSIEQACEKAKAEGIDVRAIVVINPGNPTGSSLSESEIQQVLEFSDRENMVVLADEVYQANVFTGTFHSFRKVLLSLQSKHPGKLNVELASIHSTSKGTSTQDIAIRHSHSSWHVLNNDIGITGECGHRGGYFELIGFDPQVEAQIYKFVSITLCAPVIGQCLVEMMVNPPRPGSPSYQLYAQEYQEIHETMKSRAYALYRAFQDMEGVDCREPQGSMYLFPRMRLPRGAIEHATRQNQSPDGFYCSRLLDATGICIVPGSGFGQVEGTFHFRTTFLAPGTDWVKRMKRFHDSFTAEYKLTT